MTILKTKNPRKIQRIYANLSFSLFKRVTFKFSKSGFAISGELPHTVTSVTRNPTTLNSFSKVIVLNEVNKKISSDS